jgi:hypothetical protein
LNEFAIIYSGSFKTDITTDNDMTFYLFIDDEEVGSVDQADVKNATGSEEFNKTDNYETFSEVLVEAGKSVKVRVEAEASVTTKLDKKELDLYLRGDDKNGTAAGFAKADLAPFKFVENSSVTVSDSTTAKKDTIVLEESTTSLAKFIIKPSNSNDDEITLGTLVISYAGLPGSYDITGNVTVKVDGSELDEPTL